MSPRRAKAAETPAAFETRVAEVEAIAAALGEGEMPLSEAMQAYEKGVALVGELKKELASYRRRIEQMDPGTGEISPFPENTEEKHDV